MREAYELSELSKSLRKVKASRLISLSPRNCECLSSPCEVTYQVNFQRLNAQKVLEIIAPRQFSNQEIYQLII